MKRITKKQRNRDVAINLWLRKNSTKLQKRKGSGGRSPSSYTAVDSWLDTKIREGYQFTIDHSNTVTIALPEKMNFSDQYEATTIYISAIRKLAKNPLHPNVTYRLGVVNFDNLRKISTSAALVLTAELSKWDDEIRQRLRPITDNWDADIFIKFSDLGFFDLFHNHDVTDNPSSSDKTDTRLVKYIKGRCGDSEKARQLKREIFKLVGDKVKKWTFLHSGLTEAITNVSHHAYPDDYMVKDSDKNWYLGGAYRKSTNELKIVFYDQGIGIPKSLPASEIWERVLEALSVLPLVNRKKDETLLKAAVELDRTSTGDSDRGKGLQDLLEFVKQLDGGYLSILSQKGLYKYTSERGKAHIKTESFKNPICGTLIIWKVTL